MGRVIQNENGKIKKKKKLKKKVKIFHEITI